MKRFISVLLCVIMAVSLAACTKAPKTTDDVTDIKDIKTEAPADKTEGEDTKKSPESDTEADVTDKAPETDKATETETDVDVDTKGEPDGDTSPTTLTEAEALAIAKDFVGDRDPDLGHLYSVKFDSVDAGTYCFKVSMYIEDQGRYSTCGYVLVDPDGNASKFDW